MFSHPKQNLDLRTRDFVWTDPWLRARLKVRGTTSVYAAPNAVRTGKFTPVEYLIDDAGGVSAIALFLTSLADSSEKKEAAQEHDPFRSQTGLFCDYLK